MRLLRDRASVPVIAVAAMSLIIGAVSLGLRVPGRGWLSPFPRAGRLDYSAVPPGGFAPLDPRLIAQLLGPDGRDPVAPAAGQPRARSGAPASGIMRPVPVQVSHRFTNDDFNDAYRIPSVPITAETDTTGATSQSGEPSSCSTLGGKTAWYRFTATRDVGLLADTFGSNYATALTVFRGTALGNLQKLEECSTNPRGNSFVAFPAKAGVSYFFQIDGPIGGRLIFALQEQGVTTLASVASDQTPSDGESFMSTISRDGRRLLMLSGSSTFDDQSGAARPCLPLVKGAGLPCGKLGLYLRDRANHRTINQYPEQTVALADTDLGSIAAPGALSADGRYLAFFSTVEVKVPGTNPRTPSSPYRFEVFRRDNLTKSIERVSVPCPTCAEDPNGSSARAEISADGRYVAFVSWASNLVEGDDNGTRDVFVRDMDRRITVPVSVPNDADAAVLGDRANADASISGDQGADLFSISSDGRFVAFKASAGNLVMDDMNGFTDAFVRDLVAKTTVRVNVSSNEDEANADTRSALGLGLRTISDSGRYVFFNSDATNLDPGKHGEEGHENIYRRDILRGTTMLVTVNSTGTPADAGVDARDWRKYAYTYAAPIVIAGGLTVGISPMSYFATSDGRYVVFSSDAENLVPSDTNKLTDIFMHDVVTGTTTRISVSSTGEQTTDGHCNTPSISDDARFVAFDCSATTLVGDDSNQSNDVFVRELPGPHPLSGWH